MIHSAGNSNQKLFHVLLFVHDSSAFSVVNNATAAPRGLVGMTPSLANHVITPAPISNPKHTSSLLPKDTSSIVKVIKPIDLTKENESPASDNKKVEVGEAGIETDGLVALSTNFESRMKKVEGYVSLAIFNKIPDEWKMSFGEWVSAFDLFLAYLRYYGHRDLADRFVIHRENVLAIRRERVSWIMAFRYDHAIRSAVITTWGFPT